MNPSLRKGVYVVAGMFAVGLLRAASNSKPVLDSVDATMKYMLSDVQKAAIAQLHPDYQEKFRSFINEVQDKLGWNVIITSGYRTFQKQIQLKKENPSNAAPGKSMHNFGLAIDINLQKGKEICKKADPDSKWEATGVPALARNKYGLTWGGDFKTYQDPVHFGMDHKLDMAKIHAQALKQFGSDEKVIGNKVNLSNIKVK